MNDTYSACRSDRLATSLPPSFTPRSWSSHTPSTIRPGSLITVVKTGAHGRPFRLELLDGTLLMERVLPPGTAVVMTLEANLATKHGVPAVAHAGSSGSVVLRTIDERVWREKLAPIYRELVDEAQP